jgi:hypothetical protein
VQQSALDCDVSPSAKPIGRDASVCRQSHFLSSVGLFVDKLIDPDLGRSAPRTQTLAIGAHVVEVWYDGAQWSSC